MSLQRTQPLPMQQVQAAELPAHPQAGSSASASAPAAAEQPFFRLDIVRALQMHRRLALGFALAGLVLALAYVVKSWPLYTAESQLYIQPTSEKVLNSGNQQHWPYDSNSYDSFIQQQVQIATNPDVLVGALHKLPDGSFQHAGESDDAAADRLGRAIKVERVGSSYQVSITSQAKDPQLAAEIANAVANSVVDKAAHEENAGDPQRVTILQAERDRVQNQLNADLAEQDALNKQLGMAAVGNEAPDLIDNAIGSTREELIKARTEHDEAQAKFAAVAGKGASPAALDAEADELISADPGLNSMKTSLNTRRATLIGQMSNLTPTNPEYKLDAQELLQINQSLDSMMQDLRAKAAARIEQNLRTDLERTAGVEAQLNGQLRELASTAASATPKLQRANDLVTDIARLRARFAAVDEELHNIMLQDAVPGAVHLSVTAAPPLHPALGGILKKVLPLLFGGIILGLVAALLASNLDQKVYIGADVDHMLGFQPMAALPDFSEVPEEVFDEHVLRLATAIEHARKQGHLRNCIFTGTGPQTGVTTVITRVRDTLATMGRPAVLVDATGSTRRTDQPAEEMPGTRSLAILQRVTQESHLHDESLVLTDTAPLLISAETEYLARSVDCAIVVVESGVTSRAELRGTAEMLQRLNVRAVGFVLNRVKLGTADPAFRESVQAVEKHVRSQGRTSSSSKPRAPQFAQDMQPAPADSYRDRAMFAGSVPAAAAEAAAAHAAESVVPQAPAAAATPGPMPSAWKAPAAQQQLPEPGRAPEESLPWWLSDAPAMSPAAELTTGQQPEPGSAYPASRLSGLRKIVFTASPAAPPPGTEPQYQPAQQFAVETPAPVYEPVLQPAPVYEPAYQPSVPAYEAAYQPPAPAYEPAYQQPADIVPMFEPISFDPAPAWEGGAEHRVMAAPEFLPPRPYVAPQTGSGLEETDAGRRDRRDTLDDLDVLPSWRGQYRRKT